MNDIKSKFDEVEKRVKRLVTENTNLRTRVRELEEELTTLRRDSEKLEVFNGKRVQIREKIERILNSLETEGLKSKSDGRGNGGAAI